MVRKLFIGSIVLLVAASIAQSAIIIDLIPAYGPNPKTDRVDIHDQVTINAMKQGKSLSGDRSVEPSTYEEIQSSVYSYELISSGLTLTSGFDSYMGKKTSSYPSPQSTNFSNEKGNGVYFGLKITDTSASPSLTLASIGNNLVLNVSNSAGNVFSLNNATPFAGVTKYSTAIAGVKADGSDTTDANQAVKTIYAVGVFASLDADGYGGSNLSDQQRLDGVNDYIKSFGTWNVNASVSFASANDTAQFAVIPANNPIPEPSVLGIASLGLMLLKRYRTQS